MCSFNLSKTSNLESESINALDAWFMCICVDNFRKEHEIQSECSIKDVMVKETLEGDNRIVSLYFNDCADENYLQMKSAIEEAKDICMWDYEARCKSYMFYVEFTSADDEIGYGGDISTSKNMCYVDEDENAIVFICTI